MYVFIILQCIPTHSEWTAFWALHDVASHYLFSFSFSLVHSTYSSSARPPSVPWIHPGKLPPQSLCTSVHSVWRHRPVCVHTAHLVISCICPMSSSITNLLVAITTRHSLLSSSLFFSMATYNNPTFYILLILCIVYLPHYHVNTIREGICGHFLHFFISSVFEGFFYNFTNINITSNLYTQNNFMQFFNPHNDYMSFKISFLFCLETENKIYFIICPRIENKQDNLDFTPWSPEHFSLCQR